MLSPDNFDNVYNFLMIVETLLLLQWKSYDRSMERRHVMRQQSMSRQIKIIQLYQLSGRHVRLVANFFAIVKRFLHWNGKFHFHPFHHSLTAMSDQTTNVTITSSLSCLVLQKRCGNLFCLQIFCLEGGITLLSIVHFITKWLHKSGWASACNLGKSWQSFELVSPV